MNMMNTNERVLVTGAGGFIGSHLSEALLKKGYEVVGLLWTREKSRWVKNIRASFIFGDVTKKNSLFNAVKDVTYIYHLAACTRGNCAGEYYKTNLEGTKNLVNVCLESGIRLKRFLFTSSVAALGPCQEHEVLDESVPCNPVSDYGKSKFLAEQFLYSAQDRLPITIVRLPVVYGPRNVGSAFSIFKCVSKRIQFDICQGETNVGFVHDIVDGMILASKSPVTIGKTYHLGENKIYTSKEIYATVERVLGKKTVKLKPPFPLLYTLAVLSELYSKMTRRKVFFHRYDLYDFLNYRYWRIDVGKAERDFGFKTKTPLVTGAQITADWYKKKGFI